MLGDKYFKSGAKFHETGAKLHETGAKTAHRVPNSTKRAPVFYRVTKVSGCHYLAPGLHSYRRGPAWSVICSTAVTERNYLKGKITFRPFYNSLPFSSVHMYLKTVRNYEKLCILVENNKPT